jgi:hypothetical protein
VVPLVMADVVALLPPPQSWPLLAPFHIAKPRSTTNVRRPCGMVVSAQLSATERNPAPALLTAFTRQNLAFFAPASDGQAKKLS